MKICLDAGHYGKYNQSPVNKIYYESDMSWKLHLYFKSALESHGINVITTRPNQKNDLSLTSRGSKAAGCELFLSLHSNACGDASVDYPLACCSVSGKADTLGQQLANTVHTIMGTTQTGRIWKRQGNSGDYYGVLRGAASVGVPGILMEHSFHTNLAATNWLLVDANLKKLAQAEASTIAAHYGIQKTTAANPVSTVSPTERYCVKVTVSALHIRAGAGTSYPIIGCIRDNGVYTIVQTSSNWGKLKSGAGWICLDYTVRK